MDFSEGMHQIVLQCFPYATITLDRFHMQQLVSDAMQELRIKHKKEEQKALNEQRKLFKEQLKKKYEQSQKRVRRTRKINVDANPSVRIRLLCPKNSAMVTLYLNCYLEVVIP